jgi:hypothetical protein
VFSIKLTCPIIKKSTLRKNSVYEFKNIKLWNHNGILLFLILFFPIGIIMAILNCSKTKNTNQKYILILISLICTIILFTLNAYIFISVIILSSAYIYFISKNIFNIHKKMNGKKASFSLPITYTIFIYFFILIGKIY